MLLLGLLVAAGACSSGSRRAAERTPPQTSGPAPTGPYGVYDRLRQVAEVPSPEPPATAAERDLVRRAEGTPARDLLGASQRSSPEPRVALTGTIRDYVAKVVGGGASFALQPSGFVPCSGDGDRCVAIVGDPCWKVREEDCEGMSLDVVVDVTDEPFTLDRIQSGRYLISSRDDIEDLLATAP